MIVGSWDENEVAILGADKGEGRQWDSFSLLGSFVCKLGRFLRQTRGSDLGKGMTMVQPL